MRGLKSGMMLGRSLIPFGIPNNDLICSSNLTPETYCDSIDSPRYSKILHHTPFLSHSQSTCIDAPPPPLPFPPSSISVFPSQSNDRSKLPVTLSAIH